MKRKLKTLLTIGIIGIASCSILVSCRKNKDKTPDPTPEPTPVVPDKIDITGITFEDASYPYDGRTTYSLEIKGKLPEGVSVTYENNGKTEIGEYIVKAKFSDSTGKYNVPADMTAKLTIYDASVYYTVQFKADNTLIDEASLKSGTIISNFPNIPAKNGYSSAWDYNNEPVLSDLTINALYTAIDYNITYHLDGGTNAEANKSTYNVENNITFANPNQQGCTFKGWYIDENLTQSISKTDGNYRNLDLYAKWEREEYTITYNLDGGTNQTDAPTTFKAGIDTTLPIPTKKGSTFVGWSTRSDWGTLPASAAITTTNGIYENIELYAYWTDTIYYITYNTGVVNDELQPREYTISNSVTIGQGAVEGYEFLGWTCEALGITEPVATITIPANSDNPNLYTAEPLEIVGHVGNAAVYDITYILNGGTPSSTLPDTYDKQDVYTFPDMTKEHYTFDGWYIENVNVTSTESLFGNVTIEARFSRNEHTLEYRTAYGSITNPNITIAGGSGMQKIYEDTPYILLDASLNGYTFVGWYTENSKDSEKITTTGYATSDIIVYAVFDINEYTITYSDVPSEVTNTNPLKYTISTGIDIKTLSRNGYTFNGWTCDELEITTPQQTIKNNSYLGDITLVANWSENTYNVTYHLDEVVVDTFSVTNTTLRVPSSIPDGYEFEGWYTSINCPPADKITSLEGIYSDITLYGKLAVINYEITYDLNDNAAVNNPDNPLTFTINDDAITISNPTLTNYEFLGWTCTELNISTNTKNLVIPSGTFEDITLVAHWKSITKYITYEFMTEDGNFVFEEYFTGDFVYSYNAGETVTFITPASEYFTFVGWYSDDTFETEITTSAEMTSGTVYGKVVGKTFTITIEDEEHNTIRTIEYTTGEDEEIALTGETMEGHTFTGYRYNDEDFVDSDGFGIYLVIDLIYEIPGNVTITALFE